MAYFVSECSIVYKQEYTATANHMCKKSSVFSLFETPQAIWKEREIPSTGYETTQTHRQKQRVSSPALLNFASEPARIGICFTSAFGVQVGL
jgi:hypothetical protein